MFEFSLTSLVLIAIIGAVVWHFYATKILGYVAPAESALRADWAKFRAELLGLHDTLKADLLGKHDVSQARITSVEQIVTPAASAGVTAAALPAVAPIPPTKPTT